MAWELEYPLYLVPLEAGYVSVVEPGEAESQQYYLAVFTSRQFAEEFILGCGIPCEPRGLNNPREFAWLLQSLRDPVNQVAFNPVADSTNVDAPWKVTVSELLSKHITVDHSPWNYPVFIIDQPNGFASIEGSASDGREMRAVGLFTKQEKAEAYLSDIDEDGAIVSLDDMEQTRNFLNSVLPDTTGVALDLVIEDGRQTAKYCFSIRTILDKYLVKKLR